MICADLQARANLENKNSELADSVTVTASLLASLDPECSGSWQNRGIFLLTPKFSQGRTRVKRGFVAALQMVPSLVVEAQHTSGIYHIQGLQRRGLRIAVACQSQELLLAIEIKGEFEHRSAAIRKVIWTGEWSSPGRSRAPT